MLWLRIIRTFNFGSWGAVCMIVGFYVPMASAQIITEPMPLPEGIEATGDTLEVRALTAWAREHRRIDPEQALAIAERSLTLAQNLNDQLGVGTNLMLLAMFTSDPDRQLAYYTAAEQAYEQIGDERGLARSRLNQGTTHHRRGQLEQALPFFFEALQDLENLGDVGGQVVVLNNIGNIHNQQGNLEEAGAYQERAVALAETLDNPVMYAFMLNNLGSFLIGHGSYERAEAVLSQALAISESEGTQYQTAVISLNLGLVFNTQSHYEQALAHLYVAESLSEELENDRQLLIAVYNELGKAHLGLEQFDRALYYANESLLRAQEGGAVTRQMEAHKTLWQIYKAAGNHEQALVHYEAYAMVKDSVFTPEHAEMLREMQTRYETEEQQRRIERLEHESRIQALQTSRWRIGMLAGVGGLLLILGFLYYRYRTKQKANRLLEELDATKSRFFANISHEFRTPLTVILGSTEEALARRFEKDPEKLNEHHQAILRNSHQLQRLIDEVLDLNRLESGRLELRPVPSDLVFSLRNIVAASGPLAERNGITLTLTSDVESCPRLYDEEKLEKIVGNLISNALKFTPRGGSVRVGLRCEDQVEFSVTDDGQGIPYEEQAKVFERFAQLDHGVLKGGTGIGLALAKELTELHGGTITLDSEPGEGSTFTVRLPLERTTLPAVQEEPSGTSLPEIEAFETAGDGTSHIPVLHLERPDSDEDHTTILIIEDNDDVRAYIRRSLEETYRVLEAVDGERGLQQAQAAFPDLIVSDVMLPGMDGYEVAQRLKADPVTACIPVMMLTARAAESDHVAGYGSGAEVYITKPFSPEVLQAAVERLLEERRRLRKQLQEDLTAIAADDLANESSEFLHHVRTVVLEKIYNKDFGVEELAAALYMSRRTLYRRFKAEGHLSPGDFIWSIRLEYARELLSRGKGSVSEVAYAVGFKSLSHFIRSFRDQYGELPSKLMET